MEKNLEIDIDIKYAKSVMDKCTLACKTTQSKITQTNKEINSRIKFICFQFKNIFDSGFWV